MDEESKKNEIREEFQEVLDDFNDDPSPDVNDYIRRLFAVKTKFTSTISYQKVSLRHFLDFEHREYLQSLKKMDLSRNTVRTSNPATQAQGQQNISSASNPQFQGLGMQPIVTNPQFQGLGIQPIVTNPQFQGLGMQPIMTNPQFQGLGMQPIVTSASNPQNLGLGMQPIVTSASNPQNLGLGMVRPTSQITVSSSSNQPSRFSHVVFDKSIPVDNSDKHNI
jgi:hypothetical protein